MASSARPTWSSIAPVATKLSAKIHANPATIGLVGPNIAITSHDTDRPISNIAPSKKSMAAVNSVHVLANPAEILPANKRVMLRVISQPATSRATGKGRPAALITKSNPANIVTAPARTERTFASLRNAPAKISTAPATKSNDPTIDMPASRSTTGNSADPAPKIMMRIPPPAISRYCARPEMSESSGSNQDEQGIKGRCQREIRNCEVRAKLRGREGLGNTL